MKVKEIIEEVDILVPNSINNESKLRWFNQIQKQLYMEFSVPDKTYMIQSKAGEKIFALPSDCREGNIHYVMVDDYEIPYKAHHEKQLGLFWTIVEDMLFVNHDKSSIIIIYYKPSPFDITNVEQEYSLFKDYQELLVLGCASKVARMSQQFDLSNELMNQFELLKEQARKRITKPKSKSVRVVRSWV